MTAPTLDFAPLWEIAKGVMLTGITAGVAWMVRKLNAVDSRQIAHEHILIGVDGKNGMKSKVDLLLARVDLIEERNTKIDAVVENERQQYPYPDRRAGARRLRDVMRDAEDEQLHRLTHPREDSP